ncbi:unnamed protein product [Lymnaea stagnalis]|uniref:ubiquitinyl hydrolase 1 n=1 Tax=Lymnaea stagnalis TaxID=6523 RepID=A0AAV2I587_LYMST
MSGHLSHRLDQSYHLKKDDYTYDLIGVSNHHGNMFGGHYIAFCRSPVDGKWREFNDNKVTVLEGGIATKEAYLLFYQRRSLSKDINQRLFTGDHWVFSLNLAPGLEEVTSSFSDAPQEDDSYPPHRSRSRSASPSAHKQGKENPNAAQRRSLSRPLTPQLSRRPLMPYADDNDFYEDSSPGSPPSPQREGFSRISRPVQRQTSEPYSRREMSAGPSSSTATKIKETKWKGVKDDSSLTDLNKTSAKGEVTNGFRRRDSEKHKQKPKVTVIRHEPTKSSTLPMNMSRNIGPRDFDSDARYPENKSYPSESRQISSSYESPSFLQVNLAQDISWDRYYDNSRGSEEGRRKLAQLMKQESFEKSLGEIGTIKEEPPNLARTGSTKLGPFKNNIQSSNYTKNSSTNGFSSKFDTEFNEELLTSRQEIAFFKYRPPTTSSAGYSHLDGDYEPVLEKRQPKPPWRPEQFHRLAQQHFGGRDDMRPYNKEKYKLTDEITSPTDHNFNGDMSPFKYATIGRTGDFLERGRLDSDAMPRSITLPHMIKNIQIDVQPPPSPTPPHTLKEERTYGHSPITSLPFSTSEYFANTRISNRERSIVTYEQHGRRTSDQSTFSSGSRTLPSNPESRPRFRPPRGIWGTIGRKPTPAATVSNIPTPCLRESSV